VPNIPNLKHLEIIKKENLKLADEQQTANYCIVEINSYLWR
jgi:hypothetical protein